jgi:hypothetical protein
MDPEMLVAAAAGSPVEAHLFELPGGRRVVVGWLQTLIAGQRDHAGVSQRVTLTLPRGTGSHVRRFDELGRCWNSERLPSSRRLELKPGPDQVTVIVFEH